jgi:hypothetical protein
MSTDNVAVAVNVIQSVINGGSSTTIVTAAQGPQGPTGPAGSSSITGLSDVDPTGLVNGALLIYNNQLGLWKVSKSLEEQTLECGQY